MPGGRRYLGWFSACDRWFEWEAARYGWEQRRESTSSQAADAVELPPELARLALRLSGVRAEDVS